MGGWLGGDGGYVVTLVVVVVVMVLFGGLHAQCRGNAAPYVERCSAAQRSTAHRKASAASVVYPPALPPSMHSRAGSTRPWSACWLVC